MRLLISHVKQGASISDESYQGKSFVMNLLLLLILTLCATRSSFIKAVEGIEISYEDLKKINASCHPRDSCDKARYRDSPGISANYACSCDRLCSKLGTCCIDAPHRHVLAPTIRPRCRTVEEPSTFQGFYMVDRCRIGDKFNPVWESLCEEEWNGEDNIMKIAPVTSLFTSMTYKNYFCFRCHERTHEYLLWNVELRSYDKGSEMVENEDFDVAYDHNNETWMAEGRNGTSFPVNLKFTVPSSIGSLAVPCEVDGMISNCSDAQADGDMRDKCNAYTGIVYIKRDDQVLKYKNVHCALCSSESIENMICDHQEIITTTRQKIFSFTHLININRFDGEKAGKTRKCEQNFVWDPYGDKCRKIACAIPGYTVKEGKCTPP